MPNCGGAFIHLILLSTGVVLAIPFSTLSISRFALSPAITGTSKQSA
jgi:hypothetical protein